jgi:uncharacterized membrane protein YjjB (DUF3815 family)
MPIWGFIFLLVAAILFAIDAYARRRLASVAAAALCAGLIFTFATTSSLVHL